MPSSAPSPASPDEIRRNRPSSPPIDIDDEASVDYPDRSLRWSGYRRSHVSLGPKSLLRDDAYVARITTALARGAALVLEMTTLNDNGQIAGSARQRALLRGLIAGLAATGFTQAERTEYLAYHRDWLVRFSTADEAGEVQARAGLDRQVDRVDTTLRQLARMVSAEWGEPVERRDSVEGCWQDAIAELCTWADGLRGTGPSPDPYTENRAFPLVFKAFHGMANQVGLDMLNEAFLHHLLLHATELAPVPVAESAARQPAAAVVHA